jgi:hypothetical protein
MLVALTESCREEDSTSVVMVDAGINDESFTAWSTVAVAVTEGSWTTVDDDASDGDDDDDDDGDCFVTAVDTEADRCCPIDWSILLVGAMILLVFRVLPPSC